MKARLCNGEIYCPCLDEEYDRCRLRYNILSLIGPGAKVGSTDCKLVEVITSDGKNYIPVEVDVNGSTV